MNTKNVAKLAEQVGEVFQDENPWVDGVLLCTFFRVRVNVNIQEPFVTGYWVPRKDLPKSWIFFRYERLQDFCYNYGLVGHGQRAYKNEKLVAVNCNFTPRYDAKLGVPCTFYGSNGRKLEDSLILTWMKKVQSHGGERRLGKENAASPR